MDGILSCELGLLLNFGESKVEVKRKVAVTYSPQSPQRTQRLFWDVITPIISAVSAVIVFLARPELSNPCLGEGSRRE